MPRQIITALLHTNASEAFKHRDPNYFQDSSWVDQISGFHTDICLFKILQVFELILFISKQGKFNSELNFISNFNQNRLNAEQTSGMNTENN